MGEVVNIAGELEERRFVERLSALHEKSARRIEEIKADPMPLINSLAARVVDLERAVQASIAELTGTVTMLAYGEHVNQPIEDIGATAVRRNLAAVAVLDEIERRRP